MQKSVHNFLGVHISECCRQLVEEAQALNTTIFFIFNDVKIVASKDSDPVKLVNKYHIGLHKLHKEYKNSTNYKLQEHNSQLMLSAAQIEYNSQMENFEKLNYSNHKDLLQWICNIQNHTDHIGVVKDVGRIISVLSEHGYEANMNLGDNLNKDNSSSVAQYIVGQALAGLQEIGAIHSVVHRFVKDWNEKFN